MDESVKNDFLEALNSTLHIKSNYQSREFDYAWIDMFEECVPYVDNALRNPKRFIINEEEIVKVEKAKKVTVESVIHLTQHTSFIENVDPKTGEVRPTKLLNILKDESLDTYENRFVHTLVKHMREFYDKRVDLISNGAFKLDKKVAEYEGITLVGNDHVKVNISFSSCDEGDITLEKEDDPNSIENRLKRIKIRLDGFSSTEVMQILDKLHVPDVRSPIRKTNAILKNPNLQKCNQMWNFLQSYTKDDVKEIDNNKDYMDIGPIKSGFDNAFIAAYESLNDTYGKNKALTERQIISSSIAKVIENILDINDEIMLDKLKKVFKDEYKIAKANVDIRNEKINQIFLNKLLKVSNEVDMGVTILNEKDSK